jgi:hypothetical protein
MDCRTQGSDLSRNPGCIHLEVSRSFHGGVGNRGFPDASSSGQTTTCLPSCHWIVIAFCPIWNPRSTGLGASIPTMAAMLRGGPTGMQGTLSTSIRYSEVARWLSTFRTYSSRSNS